MKKKWVLRHYDFDHWPKVTNINRVRAIAVINHLAKSASKSVHPFSWNFVHKKTLDTHTDKLLLKYNPSTISWRCKNLPLWPITSFTCSAKPERRSTTSPMVTKFISKDSIYTKYEVCWDMDHRRITKNMNEKKKNKIMS